MDQFREFPIIAQRDPQRHYYVIKCESYTLKHSSTINKSSLPVYIFHHKIWILLTHILQDIRKYLSVTHHTSCLQVLSEHTFPTIISSVGFFQENFLFNFTWPEHQVPQSLPLCSCHGWHWSLCHWIEMFFIPFLSLHCTQVCFAWNNRITLFVIVASSSMLPCGNRA